MDTKVTTIQEHVLSARAVSTPIIAIETPDPGATLIKLKKALDAHAEKVAEKSHTDKKLPKFPPQYIWNVASGLRPLNTEAEVALTGMLEPVGGDQMATLHPVQALTVLASAPRGTFVVMSNLHRFWEDARFDPAVVQALWNLRDVYKKTQRTVVLTMPDCVLPAELRNDVVVYKETMPTSEELRPIITRLHDSARQSCPQTPVPDEKVLDEATHALAGLAMQQAEQVAAISMRKTGATSAEMDMDLLREHQKQSVEQTPGVKVFDGDETFDSLHGLDALTGFLKKIINGIKPPRAFIFVDEIEKMFAGAFGQGDSSGTSQEQHGYVLQTMADTDATGIIIVGDPGTGKSALAKASGNEGGCWTLALDLGEMKGSLVGESGQKTRRALDVVDAIGQGECFWIATCNNIESLPPELKRRFSCGTWYVGMPTADARRSIWRQYGKEFGVKIGKVDFDEGWTGAEIRNCVRLAWKMQVSIKAASGYITPVSKANPDVSKRLRRLANHTFICASTGKPYRDPDEELSTVRDDDSVVIVGESQDRIIDMNES